MRKRRRTKYTWLPQVPQEACDDQWVTIRTFDFTLDGGTNGCSGGIVTPVLNDIPQADDTTGLQVSMADALGSEYFLKRIVGKFYVTASATAANAAIVVGDGLTITPAKVPTFAVTAGYYVAPEEHPAGSGIPMGFAADSDRYNPQTLDAIREPWIWRRTWLLQPVNFCCALDPYVHTTEATGFTDTGYVIPAGGLVGIGTLPSTNQKYGSVLDGPHIDAKTARRVRQHERLWFTAFAVPLPIHQAVDGIYDHITFACALDSRYLGALRRSRNRSSFE